MPLLFMSAFFLILQASAFRLKIPLLPRGAPHGNEVSVSRRSTSLDACLHYYPVAHESLKIPFGQASVPWEPAAGYPVTVIHSAPVTSDIEKWLLQTVPGLGGKTAIDALRTFQNGGCWTLVYGGAVRDAFRGKEPNDIDAEVSCPVATARQLCVNAFGIWNCHVSDSTYQFMVIGDKSIVPSSTDTKTMDVANWDISILNYNGLAAFEYTTNSLGYDVFVNKVVLDFSSNGVADTCNEIIRIPGPVWIRNEWESTIKVFRYWKLRVKGYNPSDYSTKEFIVESAKAALNNPFKQSEIQEFYCLYVLLGSYESSSHQCTITDCSNVEKQIKRYDAFLSEDLGYVWNVGGRNLVNEITQNCLSNSAAVAKSFNYALLAIITVTKLVN